ncbi:MAG: glycosyltransferase family 4 protein [Chloroflexota bacterium]
MRVHILVTEINAHGGIQRYNRQMMRATRELVDEQGGEMVVFSLNDSPQSPSVRGFGRSHRRFVTSALTTAVFERPDVLIVGHVNFASLLPAYRLLWPRTRSFVVAYGKEVEGRLKPGVRTGLRMATGVLPLSESTRHLVLAKHGVPAERAHLLRYGFDPRRHTPPIARPPGYPRVLSVARLRLEDAYKGIDTTLEALPDLCRQFPGLRYTVVGEGDDLPRLHALAGRLGISDRVEFAGSVGQQELENLYEECDIFVLPSTHEGLGIVYLEAMARGKPVVGIRAGGVADAVVHEANGLLVEHKSPESVGGAVSRLANDPDLCRRLGAWGQRCTVPAFARARMQARLSEILTGETGKK